MSTQWTDAKPPCLDRDSNVCVAEGCYGRACVTPDPPRANRSTDRSPAGPHTDTRGFRPNPAPTWPWFRLPRLRLTGVPAWVRRRVAAREPIDQTDHRA